MKTHRRSPLLLAIVSLLVPLAAGAQTLATAKVAAAPPAGALPAIVILVRHAEKATEPADDPALTGPGTERAKALATALADARVTAIITTQWRRTRETAAPLATARGLTPEIVATEPGKPAGAHAEAVAEAVARHPGGVVLVVGHSNTIPAIIAALGGPQLPDLADTAYGDLFVMTPGAGEAHLIRAQYGEEGAKAAPTAPNPPH